MELVREKDVDIKLWDEMREGDELALRDLYILFYPKLIQFGLRYTVDRGQIKDTINNTFLYFWEKRSQLSDAKNVKNYVITSFLRQLSKDLNNKVFIDIDNLHTDELFYESDEFLMISRQDELNKVNVLKKAILQLPSRQRELIMLRYYEGLSYDEIVDKTQLTKRAVYNQIHLAINTLKKNSQISDLNELLAFIPFVFLVIY